MDASVGKTIYESRMRSEPESKTITSNGLSEYVYSSRETGCKWGFVVNNKTSIIESWHYLSDPDKCYLWIDWGAPW